MNGWFCAAVLPKGTCYYKQQLEALRLEALQRRQTSRVDDELSSDSGNSDSGSDTEATSTQLDKGEALAHCHQQPDQNGLPVQATLTDGSAVVEAQASEMGRTHMRPPKPPPHPHLLLAPRHIFPDDGDGEPEASRAALQASQRIEPSSQGRDGEIFCEDELESSKDCAAMAPGSVQESIGATYR